MSIVESIFNNAIKSLNLEVVNKLAVAVSGGSDSLSLVFLLHEYFKKTSIEIIAITVDHNLREESATEAKFVFNLLKKYNIKHITLQWEQESKQEGNIQAKAREARYNLLTNFCKSENIGMLFIGHNKEDIAENFLIRLKRGSGIDGLAAIEKVCIKNNITIFRPLLNISRNDLKNYLTTKNIRWIDDPSNKNIKFERVKIRMSLEGNDEYISRINIAANHLRIAKNYLDKKINECTKRVVKFTDFGAAFLCQDEFLNLEEYEKDALLSNILQIIGGSKYKGRYKSFQKLTNKMLSREFKGATLMGCNIKLLKNQIFIIFREEKSATVLLNQNMVTWDKILKIAVPGKLQNDDLAVSNLGKKGWQGIDKDNICLNSELNKLPREVLFSMPVIKKLEKIVAIPHIDYYEEDKYKEIIFSKINSF